MRRSTLVLVVLSLIAACTTAIPAAAQSTQSRLDDARRDATQAKSEYERLAQAYAEAEHNKQETEGRINRTRGEIGRAESDMSKLQNQLKDRVRTAYRMRGVGFFQFLL
jgi:peptidoglycan hydrolase CwlO-like protein